MIILCPESERSLILMLCLSRNKYVAVAENYMQPKETFSTRRLSKFLIKKKKRVITDKPIVSRDVVGSISNLGGTTLRGHFSPRKKGHFLRIKRALLCLQQNVGAPAPSAPRFLRL